MCKRIGALLLTIIVIFFCCAVPERSTVDELEGICGVDLSKWNGKVDFSLMKRRGIDFAILRAYSLEQDPTFETNYENAVKHSIAVGAYNYMYATSEASARKEAYAALAVLNGRKLDYPYFLDVEDESLKSLGKEKLTELCLIELKIFQSAGYNVGLYSSLSFFNNNLDKSKLDSFVLWLAKWTYYSAKETYLFPVQSFSDTSRPSCSIWQWSDSGRGSYYGVESQKVDFNYSYVDFLTNPEYSKSFNPNDYEFSGAEISDSSNENDVSWLQAALYQLGYRTTVSGKFTEYTVSVLKQFQKDNFIKKTGVADLKTINAIKSALNNIENKE